MPPRTVLVGTSGVARAGTAQLESRGISLFEIAIGIRRSGHSREAWSRREGETSARQRYPYDTGVIVGVPDDTP